MTSYGNNVLQKKSFLNRFLRKKSPAANRQALEDGTTIQNCKLMAFTRARLLERLYLELDLMVCMCDLHLFPLPHHHTYTPPILGFGALSSITRILILLSLTRATAWFASAGALPMYVHDRGVRCNFRIQVSWKARSSQHVQSFVPTGIFLYHYVSCVQY